MKNLLIALCLAVGFASPAFAAEEKAPTAQQNKMGACNKEAGEKALKGDERKKFMSDCLKAKAPEPAKEAAAPMKEEAPKEKLTPMATCNKAAGEKAIKGDVRKKFMSDCLKAKGPENMK
ncbi:MAG: PsiF family protein [Sulfuricella sp.]